MDCAFLYLLQFPSFLLWRQAFTSNNILQKFFNCSLRSWNFLLIKFLSTDLLTVRICWQRNNLFLSRIFKLSVKKAKQWKSECSGFIFPVSLLIMDFLIWSMKHSNLNGVLIQFETLIFWHSNEPLIHSFGELENNQNCVFTVIEV